MGVFRKRTFWFVVLVCLVGALGAGIAHADDALYQCPMHPQVVSDKPGECPICHMRLVKRDKVSVSASQGESREHKGPAGYAAVTINPEKQQLIGIKTALVRKQELQRSLRTAARVAYDPELYQAQIDYLREYRISQGSLRNRELAFRNLQDSRWEAPRIDIAKAKLLVMGMDEESIQGLVDAAKADEALLYARPDGEVVVFAYVFESEAPWLNRGDRVRLDTASAPARSYEGMIHSIGSMVEAETRRIHLHIRLKNDGFLKPEMLLNATIESSSGEGLAVPEEAVFFTGTDEIVFVDMGEGLFEPRKVKVGMKAGESYEIISGLSENEKVVVNGNFLLDSESRLKSSIQQAGAQHAAHASQEASHD